MTLRIIEQERVVPGGLYNEELFHVLQLRDHVAALRPVSHAIEGEFSNLPVFFDAHRGHEIVLENGYGQECLRPADRWGEDSRFR